MAILAADVVGYSRLMSADETGTLACFNRLRAEVFEPQIVRFEGRIVGSAGDSLLVEFASAVHAMECAVDIQQKLTRENSGRPASELMAFRMGVNLGDVVAQDNSIYGDDVNIAVRLEKLAEPGGICIAHIVYEQVKSKIQLRYHDLGEKKLHNIAAPVRVYRVGVPSVSSERPKKPMDRGADELAGWKFVPRTDAAEVKPLLVDRKELEACRTMVIGRDGDQSDLIVSVNIVSGRHAELSYDRELDLLAIRDLDSHNGTRLDGQEIGDLPVAIKDGALVDIGGVEFQLEATRAKNRGTKTADLPEQAWLLSGLDSDGRVIQFELRASRYQSWKWVVGRDYSVVDCFIRDLSVSRLHVMLKFTRRKGLEIEDLGSKNGTFVDGKEIRKACVRLKVPSEILLGDIRLTLSAVSEQTTRLA